MKKGYLGLGLFPIVLTMIFMLSISLPSECAAQGIVDNLDVGFSWVGTWGTSVSIPNYYGSNYHYSGPGSGSDTATWDAELVGGAGHYEVFVWYTEHANRATNAPFTINHDGDSDTVLVDQRINGSQWVRLETTGETSFYFAGTVNEDVTLSDAADGYLIADAVKFELVVAGAACPGANPADIMVKVGPLCVDVYEASVWSDPTGGTQYGTSSDDYPCSDNGNDCSSANSIYARSVAGVTPSVYITWFQAQQACAMSGKRLLTNAEWQMAAAGTPDDDSCNINNTVPGVATTGNFSGCVSNWGVNDMVGNLWEWVADWMQANSGTDNGSVSSSTYGDDGIYGIDEAHPEGDRFPAALYRGGHWGIGADAGVFALGANSGPSGLGNGLGFRCAR